MPELIIQMDASKTELGAVCKRVKTGESWPLQEQKNHISVLGLLTVRFAIVTFTWEKSVRTTDLQIDNFTGFTYLLKMGGTSLELPQIFKEIWHCLLVSQITITAEYLQSSLNQFFFLNFFYIIDSFTICKSHLNVNLFS